MSPTHLILDTNKKFKRKKIKSANVKQRLLNYHIYTLGSKE